MSIWVQKFTDIFIYIRIDISRSVATRTSDNSHEFGRSGERCLFCFSAKKEPFELGVKFPRAFVSDALGRFTPVAIA